MTEGRSPDLATLAIEAREFIEAQRYGALSTHSTAVDGFPFGSMVPYLTRPTGEVVLYLAALAEHYRNLVKDSRASLLVLDLSGVENPQSSGRATMLCTFRKAAPEELGDLLVQYESRFPNTVPAEIASNFTFFIGEPVRVRWIGGFGRAGWVSAERYRAVTSGESGQ